MTYTCWTCNETGSNENSKFHVEEIPTVVCKTFCKVIGISPGLREFDTHHVLFKNFKYEQSRAMCQRRLLELQRKVKEEYEIAKIFVEN